jgi:hypothetical protein
MMRADLVVPAHLISSLRLPALSVTTGGTDVEWVEIPTSRWWLRRRPAQRLPLDPRSARRARRYLRVQPWSLAARLIAGLAWTNLNASSPSSLSRPVALVGWIALLVWSIPYVNGSLPPQTPYRIPAGDLRIPQVPIEVAKQWVELNPGVVPTVEPVPRPRPRRWYATWAAGTLVAAMALLTVLESDGREDSGFVWLGVLALFITGGVTALKVLPPGYIRVDNRSS